MQFSEYQQAAQKYSIYPKDKLCSYTVMGLASECGEVADIFKKAMRDRQGLLSDADKSALKKELGDVLWYITAISTDLGFDMGSIAMENLIKLQSRLERHQLTGTGDNR